MRGFLGFPLEGAQAEELAAFAGRHCGKPTLAGDLHLTVKFLSEFSSDRFVEVLPELSSLGAPPDLASVTAGLIEVWPTATVLLGKATPAFHEWQRAQNDLLERRGFLHERHPVFRPHITLGRGQGNLSEDERKQFLNRKIHLRPLVLYRSQPIETGRRHHEYLSPLFS